MRIIAGDLRRRTLLTNPGMTTRPITDRAKVMLFDHIRWELKGARVADIFAGTGTMGFESLSRGALSAVFCEADHRAHELLVENARLLNVTERCLCWRVDVFRCSFRPKGESEWNPFGVIFFDPPYSMVKDIRPGSVLYKSLSRLARPDVSTENALLVFRTPAEAEYELPAIWKPEMELDIGSMKIALLRKSSEQADSTTDDDTPSDDDTSEAQD